MKQDELEMKKIGHSRTRIGASIIILVSWMCSFAVHYIPVEATWLVVPTVITASVFIVFGIGYAINGLANLASI